MTYILNLVIEGFGIFLSFFTSYFYFHFFFSINFTELIQKISGIQLLKSNIDEIDEMIDNYALDFKITNNYYILVDILYFISFIIALIYLHLVNLKYNYLFVSSFFISYIYATLILSLRKNTFNEYGLPAYVDFFIFKLWRGYYNLKRYDENIKYDDKYYSFGSYLIISLAMGFIPTSFGLVALLEIGTPILLFWGILGQTIVLFPDKLDKILPFNFKKWTGGTFLLLFIIPFYFGTFYMAYNWFLLYI